MSSPIKDDTLFIQLYHVFIFSMSHLMLGQTDELKLFVLT